MPSPSWLSAIEISDPERDQGDAISKARSSWRFGLDRSRSSVDGSTVERPSLRHYSVE